jgi:nucleoside-diphosphate-sugar epimerase
VLSYESDILKEKSMHSSPQVVVILGAGPVGSATAEVLAGAGHKVRVVSRSGRSPISIAAGDSMRPKIETAAVDVGDDAALQQHTSDADVIVNALNPDYTKWARDWPPLHQSIMQAARANDAAIVMMDNLYCYGNTGSQPMSPSTPMAPTGIKGKVRADMSAELLAAHANGQLRVAIARASDFVGPGVVDAAVGERAVKPLLAGKTVRAFGDIDAERSWGYMPDVAATVARLCTDEATWGRVWHVPSPAPVSTRGLVAALAGAAGVPVKVSAAPRWVMMAGGVFVPLLKELRETMHQFEHRFVIDASETTVQLGIEATNLNVIAADTVAWWRAKLA